MKHCPQCSTGYPDSLAACPTHGVPLNEIRDLKPGMVIHHSYRIVRKLGQGGMGAVYLAQHTLMDEPRALKFLSAELSSDQAFTARFLRETGGPHLTNKVGVPTLAAFLLLRLGWVTVNLKAHSSEESILRKTISIAMI